MSIWNSTNYFLIVQQIENDFFAMCYFVTGLQCHEIKRHCRLFNLDMWDKFINACTFSCVCMSFFIFFYYIKVLDSWFWGSPDSNELHHDELCPGSGTCTVCPDLPGEVFVIDTFCVICYF